MAPTKNEKKKPGFEESLAELEKIVGEMEDGTLSLEEMTRHFERGTELVKFCTGKLNEVEQKIEMLVKKGEEVTVEPFDNPSPEARETDVPF
jgi:exodeoxyribonuclease VII small subunit